jgi:hypothetical protein
MKTALAFLTVLMAAALVAAPAAQARQGGEGGFRVRLELPIAFSDPTPACPAGIARYGISFRGQSGSGENCIQDFIAADCPPGVEGLFCQTVPVLITLRLPGGSMEIDGSLFEVFTCGDPNCATFAVDQQWSGTVTSAERRFQRFRGGSLSGGGVFVLDATTFEILAIDEVLVISAAD